MSRLRNMRKAEGKEVLLIIAILLPIQIAVAFIISAITVPNLMLLIPAAICFALAVIMTVIFGFKRHNKSKIQKRETMFFRSLYEFVEQNGVSVLPEPLKTYFVLYCQLFGSMIEYGFELYFSDTEHPKEELIPACEKFGNDELTAICRDAIALSEKYDFSDVEALPKECKSETQKLDDRFFALCDKTDLPAAIEKYYADRGGIKDPAVLNGISL